MISLQYDYNRTTTQPGVLSVGCGDSDLDCDQVQKTLHGRIERLVTMAPARTVLQIVIKGDDPQCTLDAADLLRQIPQFADCVRIVTLPMVSLTEPRWNVVDVMDSVPAHRPCILPVQLLNKTTILQIPPPTSFGHALLIPEYNLCINMCCDRREVRLCMHTGHLVQAEIVWFDEKRYEILSNVVALKHETYDQFIKVQVLA